MADKPANVRNRIPSVSELLENPSIRVLAERWNRSAVVAGVRSLLDEIRSDINRRGAEAVWPTLRELAERAARHIATTQQSSQHPAINATGHFWGAPWVARPQCDTALERAFATGREFVAASISGTRSTFSGDFESIVCRITGAPAATAAHSYAGGLWLALAAAANGRDVIVSRGQLGDVESGCPLAKLIASSGAILKEVGSTNRTSVADYSAAITENTAAVLTICPDAFHILGDTSSTEFDAQIALAREHNLFLIDALSAAPIVDPSAEVQWPERSAQASIAAGANLVILRGDGLAGGPACGLLAGDSEIIEKIITHPLFAAYQLDAPRAAALAATLQCHLDHASGESMLPMIELLATPLENLRNRAERLAPQLALADGVRAADAVPLLSHCDGLPNSNRAIRSYGVALTPAGGDVASLERRLTSAAEPVFGRMEGDRLTLDLRTVLPRHDQTIVRALVGPSSSPPSNAAVAQTGAPS